MNDDTRLYVITTWGNRIPVRISEGVVANPGQYRGLSIDEVQKICEENNWKFELFEDVKWGEK